MSMFQVVLREGITGGIVAPTIKQVIEIRGDGTNADIRHSMLKSESKTDYLVQGGSLSTQEIQDVLVNLKQQLQQLPTEEPAGSEDIYGQDISIALLTDDFQWQNGGPEGCVGGESSRQATPEQKLKFKALVEMLVNVGQQHAVNVQ
ncbi:hypothetical protein DFQ28_007262 [Apophysomyces sp. BC1034]|nr:hypothetical protein DFQ30_007232 [Apophysomyces sp. BC1015]KAG0176409.1 hypothetical protein DFQ29_006177 [Apophysomyces sp. BC1021]KAG0186834.1 hypothetical protein DFQ28_007262 [Apophysomyces sp. BC1034]